MMFVSVLLFMTLCSGSCIAMDRRDMSHEEFEEEMRNLDEREEQHSTEELHGLLDRIIDALKEKKANRSLGKEMHKQVDRMIKILSWGGAICFCGYLFYDLRMLECCASYVRTKLLGSMCACEKYSPA